MPLGSWYAKPAFSSSYPGFRKRQVSPRSQAEVPSFGSTSSTAPRIVPFILSINRFFVQVALNPAAFRGRRSSGSPTVKGSEGSVKPPSARIAVFIHVYEPENSNDRKGWTRMVVSTPQARDLPMFSESKLVGRLPVE